MNVITNNLLVIDEQKANVEKKTFLLIQVLIRAHLRLAKF